MTVTDEAKKQISILLKEDEIKKFIEEENFIEVFTYALDWCLKNKTGTYYTRFYILSGLIELFKKFESTYKPNCWVIIQYSSGQWWFMTADNSGVGTIDINDSFIWDSKEQAEKRIKAYKKYSDDDYADTIELLGLIE